MKNYYIVEVYNSDGCRYDTACLSSLKKAKKFIAGSAYACIIKCNDAIFATNKNKWYPVGDYKNIFTGRKCDILCTL